MGATANLAARDRTQTLPAIRSTRNKPRLLAKARSLSEYSAWPATRSKGFTLVEILVVMLIIAVIISLTVLTVSSTGRDSQLDEESRRIEGLVGLLHERALLEGRDFGLRIEPAAYEFVVYDPRRDRWMMLDQEREFRHRELPKGISFQLQLDSQTVVIKPIDRNLSSGQQPNPQVAIAASGEGTPFRLILLRQATQAKAAVDGDALGKVSRQGSNKVEKRS
jgi:general secretion pathway protein H